MATMAVQSSDHSRRDVPHPSDAPRFAPTRLASDDLLTETLVAPEDQREQGRDYTDDLEDLVRMQVTQQLHSRRSQQTIHLSINTASSSRNLLPLSSSLPEPTSPTSASHRSLIPRLQPTALSSRSPSPEVPRSNDKKERSGSMSSSTSFSRIPTSTNMLRGNSNNSTTSKTHYESENEENEGQYERRGSEGERWETLQVGGVWNRSQTTREPFPRSERSLPTTTPTRKARPSDPNDPTRKRAQTNLSTSKPSHTTPQPNRKPYSNRTNYTPSPTTSSTTARKSKSSNPPPTRRKSISTAREFSSYDLSSLPPEAFSPSAVPPAPIPHPSPLLSDSLIVSPDAANSHNPLIYKNSRGELTDKGREEDRIIPTVAKKLEAERLRRLMEGGHEGLVDEWGVDGTPRSQKKVRGRRGDGQGGEDDGGEVDEEGATDREEFGSRRVGNGGGGSDERGAQTLNENEKPQVARNDSHLNNEQSTTTNDMLQTEKPLPAAAATNRRHDVEDKDANKASCCGCIIS
ncbi:hypothetical protein JCM16303_001027 [Sporobolomyces ruberrimus]